MKIYLPCVMLILLILMSCSVINHLNNAADKEKTTFQTSNQWKPLTDIRADVSIVYGANDYQNISFKDRVESWREKGYKTHFMTGIAWGRYDDYFRGRWDGVDHTGDGQVDKNGKIIWHGENSPYYVPTENYLKYIKERQIKKAIDAGIDAIYLEEPEFWARSGYSESFKKEWQKYYGTEWRPQHESPENTYLSNKLKYHLYYNALNEVLTYAKEYGASKGLKVRCFVPTHSLLNYSQWQIVSPEASLASLSCVDGYIAQVWTGTSREPNYYNGLAKERVFETAFLEYGCMRSMTAPTNRKLYFLTDPIEDWPRDWIDYKKNYQATFAAQLFYPDIENYEVMPWPDRIYEGLYSISKNSAEKAHIPSDYATQMQIMINTLNDIHISRNKISGTQGISVLMANSLMFQRFPTHNGYEDPQLSNFYGEALPFLKRGIPVGIVHIENVGYKNAFDGTRILLMSYSNMKPLSEEPHDFLAKWVYNGGIIIYSGRDDDPFQTVNEWWNTGHNNFKCPSDNLFEKLGIGKNPEEGIYHYGKGKICVIRMNPKEFVMETGRDNLLIQKVVSLYEQIAGKKPGFTNKFYLERGPYTIISVLDESVSDNDYNVDGLFIDLFDPELPILTHKTVKPGEQSYLYNIHRTSRRPHVLASASRIYDEKTTSRSYTFIAKSPLNTTNIMRILLPAAPVSYSAKLSDNELAISKFEWDQNSKTVLMVLPNNPQGVEISFNW